MTDTLTACARAMEERAVSWSRDYPGLAIPEECPYDILARACLTALAENVSEGMVEAFSETLLDDPDYNPEETFRAAVRAAVGERG